MELDTVQSSLANAGTSAQSKSSGHGKSAKRGRTQGDDFKHDKSQTPKGPRGKKKKRSRDSAMPRQPISGYFRFLNDHREKVRAEQPHLSFSEIVKQLGSDWSTLPKEQKQKYLDAADKEKEQYNREMQAYKQTEAYRAVNQKSHDKNNEIAAIHNDAEQEKEDSFDIPIFTEEFLDHNKARETELRHLRKINTQYEEQTAVLHQHVENLKSAVNRLEVETDQQRNNNMALQQHLESLRRSLLQAFRNIPLPDTKELPTLMSINSYMTRLHAYILDPSHQDESLIGTIRDIVGRLEIQ